LPKCLKDSQAKKALHLNALFFKKMETRNHSNGAYSEKVLGRRTQKLNCKKMRKLFLMTTMLLAFGLAKAQYMYDGSGRQIGKVSGEYFHDGSGRQIGKANGGYIYDGSGRQIGKTSGGYIYDGSGRQIGKTSGEYLYDGSGRQIGKISGEYLYDGSGRQIGKAQGLRRLQVIIFFYFFM
jgi:hypothetical protein